MLRLAARTTRTTATATTPRGGAATGPTQRIAAGPRPRTDARLLGATPPLRRLATATNETGRVVYRGGFETPLKYLKRVSLFSCACTVVGVPLLAYASQNPRMKPWHKFALAFVCVTVGVTTTAALHVVARPYVARLRYDPAARVMVVDHLNVWGGTRTSTVAMRDVRASSRPWATFQVAGDASRSFFVEADAAAYEDQDFREELWAAIGARAGAKG